MVRYRFKIRASLLIWLVHSCNVLPVPKAAQNYSNKDTAPQEIFEVLWDHKILDDCLFNFKQSSIRLRLFPMQTIYVFAKGRYSQVSQ